MNDIPIVTSNESIISHYRIPECDYSTECPESKRFESSSSSSSSSALSRSNDIVIVPKVQLADDEDIAVIQEDKNGNDNGNGSNWIHDCCITKPISVTAGSAGTDRATNTAVMMNAIGQDINKQWDAILSIRYYDIVTRKCHVHVQQQQKVCAQKQPLHILEIMTTITTVADLHLQISPTSKPFAISSTTRSATEINSLMNNNYDTTPTRYTSANSTAYRNHNKTNNNSSATDDNNGDDGDTSAISIIPTNFMTEYNHSITLFAKSFTNEYPYHQNNNNNNDDQQQILDLIQKTQYSIENPKYTWSDVVPQIMFSSNDSKFLSCVIPHPIPILSISTPKAVPKSMNNGNHHHIMNHGRKPCSLSSVVIFSLDWRKKKSLTSATITTHNATTTTTTSTKATKTESIKIPIPFYIQSTLIDENLIRKRQRQLQQQNTGSNINHVNTTTTTTTTTTTNNNNNNTSNKIIITSHSPTIYNPRTVTFDDSIYNMDDNDEMLDQKASMLLSQITTICDIHVDNTTSITTTTNKSLQAHPLLLAGCTDGSILLIGYKRAKLMALLHFNDIDNDQEYNIWNNNHQHGIIHMMYMCSPSIIHDNNNGNSNTISNTNTMLNGNHHGNNDIGCCRNGRLIIIQRNGQIKFYKTHFYIRKDKNHHHQQQQQNYNQRQNPIYIQQEIDCNLYTKQQDQKSSESFIHGIFLEYDIVAFLTHPYHRHKSTTYNKDYNDTIAQIWYIGNVTKGNGGLLINQLILNDERLMDLNHGFLSMKKKSEGALSKGGGQSMLNNVSLQHFAANFKLHHEKRTNSLVISSASSSIRMNDGEQVVGSGSSVFLRPFITIWKWRTSRIGFTLVGESLINHPQIEDKEDDLIKTQIPLFMNDLSMTKHNDIQCYSLQNISLCYDSNIGYALSYISAYGDDIFQKKILSIGVLSPSSSRNNDDALIDMNGPSSLFLTHDSISFLDSISTSITKDMTIQWMQSKVPSSYRCSNGNLEIATVGNKFGRSIAVAASRGFCILDLSFGRDEQMRAAMNNEGSFISPCTSGFECSDKGCSSGVGINHPKWKMFSEIHERSFCVQTMAWWERNNSLNGSSEDILLCTVNYIKQDCRQMYLAAWSRRRLGLDKNQILNEYGKRDEQRKGLKLPFGFIPTRCSILIEPSNECSRAVILLISRLNLEINYLICQLQISEEHDALNEDNNLKVGGSIACFDSISLHDFQNTKSFIQHSISQHYGLFLAGANFQYNFLNASEITPSDRYIIATLGIVHNLGRSVTSVEISSSKKASMKTVIDLGASPKKGSTIPVVEKIWSSFMLESSFGLDNTKMDHCINTAFAISDGSIFVWSVAINGIMNEVELNDPILFGPLQLFPDDDPEKSKMFLGSLPSVVDRFLLYSSQEHRNIRLPIDHINSAALNSKSISVYGVSDFMVGAPTFTPSLLLRLYERPIEKTSKMRELILSFKRRKFYDSTNASIRVIVSFITDQLHQLRNVRSIDRLSFYEHMLADIVGLTKSSLSTVQFACVFLSIARQLEHYHLDHLFPLPLQTESHMKHITVEDLFNVSVLKKSLPVASSSLPIFETTDMLHEYCLDLLHHCITTIFDFVSEDEYVNLWCLREECFFIQQIFHYTVKLEDSYEAQQYHYEDSTQQYSSDHDEDSVVSDNYANGIEDSYFSSGESCNESESELIDDLESESFEDIDDTLVENTSRIRRLAAVLTPSFLKTTNKQKNDDEEAIALAASTFVKSSFPDLSMMDNTSRHNEETGISIASSFLYDDSMQLHTPAKGSVSELVGKAIASCFYKAVIEKNDQLKLGLKQIAVLSTLLQSQNNDRDFELYSTLDLIGSLTERAYRLSLELLEDKIKYGSKHHLDVKTDGNSNFITTIMFLTEMCVEHWSVEDAKEIYELMLSLLARYKHVSEGDYLVPILVIVTIISSHISCQIRELFRDGWDENEIGRLFKKSLSSLRHEED